MKKNILKLISSVIIVSSIAVPASAAFAENDMDIEINTNEISAKTIDIENSVIIDNNIIENAEIILSDDNTALFPARSVFEAMGYNVEWYGKTKSIVIEKIPHYITFTIGTDGYTFAKTAPIKLNKAPELINETTYVPITLLSEIMEMDASLDENGNLIINSNKEIVLDENEDIVENENLDESSGENENLDESSGENENLDESSGENENLNESSNEDNNIETNAEVISLNDDEGILINDVEKGEILLVPNENTEIIFEDESPAAIEDIKETSKLFVQYGEEMTMSIPPINNPLKIVIK